MVNELYDSYSMSCDPMEWQPFDENGFASLWAPRLWRAAAAKNYFISMVTSLIIALIFLLFSEQCRHWCLFPLVICGTLAGDGIIAWLRREIDIFDPKAIISGALYLNCFLAPLLHLAYNIYGQHYYMSDWPFYFGFVAIFNAIGLVLLKIGHNIFFKFSRPTRSYRQIIPGKFWSVALPVVGVSFAALLVIKLFFGGLAKEGGEIIYAGGSGAYAAQLSWIMMLADPFPILVIMVVVYWLQGKTTLKPTGLTGVILVLIGVIALQLYVHGVRGSRSAILIGVITATILIHYRLRPLSMKFVLLTVCVMVLFVYFYGFYKRFGKQGWQAFYSSKARAEMKHEQGSGGTVGFVIGQFAKADVQAFLAYRLHEYKGEYRYRKGLTYAMSVLTFIPRGIWKTKPKSVKAEAGTEIQGFSGLAYSSAVYGMAGEAMLNFGYYSIPFPFLIFGSVLGYFRKKIFTMEPCDARFFVIPIIVLTLYLALGDTNNWTFGLLRMGTLPFTIVYLSSTKARFASISDTI